MSQGDRVEAMLARTAAAAASLPSTDRERLARALRAALDHRQERLPQEDPRTLHPARTVLILTDDLKTSSVEALLAGALAESEERELRVDAARVDALAGADARALLHDVPDADDEMLMERLLTADPAALDVALAERLDQLRHLHLRPPPEWSAAYASARDAYLPVAERRGGVLARRYRWWCSMFERKYLRAGNV